MIFFILQVLCASPCNISWMKSRNGRTPSNAIPVGMTSYEEKLYLGRAMYNGSLTLGKVNNFFQKFLYKWKTFTSAKKLFFAQVQLFFGLVRRVIYT